MANKMVANIKSLSEGVTGLTKHVNELYAALAKVNIVASKTLKDAKGAVNTVGGTANLTKGSTRMDLGTESASFAQPAGGSGLNRMSTSLAKFSQTPGGMAALDLLINSLSDSDFWVPKYHWGSWNKILKIHNKNILQFDDFNLSEFRPENGVVMLCFPSNPTGWIPDLAELEEFMQYANSKGITVILDIPYFYLFNEENHPINNLFTDNVIVVSSFSKSLGLSGFRVGYVATKNAELQKSMRVRSLYKYNSISNVPQKIILKMLTSIEGNRSLSEYCELTKSHISKNIQYLKERNFLFSEYPSDPIGPFAIVNINFDELLLNKISSVPLKKFSLDKTISNDYSRISLAVNSDLFKKYSDLIN